MNGWRTERLSGVKHKINDDKLSGGLHAADLPASLLLVLFLDERLHGLETVAPGKSIAQYLLGLASFLALQSRKRFFHSSPPVRQTERLALKERKKHLTARPSLF